MAKNTEKNTVGFVLQFVGGLLLLIAAVTLWSVSSAPSYWNGGIISGAMVATFLYAAAMLSVISLLFLSFAQLGPMAAGAGWKAMKTTTIGSFSLLVLSGGNPTLFVVTLIGFLVASSGVASAMMRMDWKGKR